MKKLTSWCNLVAMGAACLLLLSGQKSGAQMTNSHPLTFNTNTAAIMTDIFATNGTMSADLLNGDMWDPNAPSMNLSGSTLEKSLSTDSFLSNVIYAAVGTNICATYKAPPYSSDDWVTFQNAAKTEMQWGFADYYPLIINECRSTNDYYLQGVTYGYNSYSTVMLNYSRFTNSWGDITPMYLKYWYMFCDFNVYHYGGAANWKFMLGTAHDMAGDTKVLESTTTIMQNWRWGSHLFPDTFFGPINGPATNSLYWVLNSNESVWYYSLYANLDAVQLIPMPDPKPEHFLMKQTGTNTLHFEWQTLTFTMSHWRLEKASSVNGPWTAVSQPTINNYIASIDQTMNTSPGSQMYYRMRHF